MSDCVLGRNTRMLACHSRDRTQAGFHLDKDLKSTMAVYYRALLKDLCTKFYPTVLDRDGRDLRVGKIYSKIEKSNTPFIGIVCLYRFLLKAFQIGAFCFSKSASQTITRLLPIGFQ